MEWIWAEAAYSNKIDLSVIIDEKYAYSKPISARIVLWVCNKKNSLIILTMKKGTD